MTKEKILITSALPYANGPLHFGHIAGAYLPADCYARFKRLQGADVLFISGSDEYGVAITLSADLAGKTPKEHVDMYHEVIRGFFSTLNMSFDHYSRTTWEGHLAPVQKFFLDLLENGYIEPRVTEQLYSEAEGRFLADRYVVGICPKCQFAQARGDECPSCGASFDAIELKDPRSKLTGAPLTKKKTKHWFLLLEKFKDRLTEWIERKQWKPNVVNFVKGYIDELHARSITRDSSWGVPVPLEEAEGKVLYVWFDAPIGYISSTMQWALEQGDKDLWKDYWCDEKTKLVHFIGKDNIPFHAVIFPAMVMGQNLPLKLVDELPANEFYKLEGRQFSKSDGWMIDLEGFFKKYSADQIRYAIAANAPETQDSEFTWKDFQLRCNSELLGKFGNFIHRVMVFAKNNTNAEIPALDNLKPVDSEFLDTLRRLCLEAEEAFNSFKVRRASQIVMEIAALGNVYFDAKKPWKEAKGGDVNALKTTLAACFMAIKALALVSYPIIPETAEKVWKALGFKDALNRYPLREALAMIIPSGQKILEPEILFRKVEDAEIEEEIAKLKKGVEKTPVKAFSQAPIKAKVAFDDFAKLDLRVGQILSAEPVPKSKKLLCLQVDIGFEKRQIIAGIALSYTPESLIGKKVVVVANLEPATLMGVESQGMLLLADSPDGMSLLNPGDGCLGAEIK